MSLRPIDYATPIRRRKKTWTPRQIVLVFLIALGFVVALIGVAAYVTVVRDVRDAATNMPD